MTKAGFGMGGETTTAAAHGTTELEGLTSSPPPTQSKTKFHKKF